MPSDVSEALDGAFARSREIFGILVSAKVPPDRDTMLGLLMASVAMFKTQPGHTLDGAQAALTLIWASTEVSDERIGPVS